jgi:hypothetical protein
MIVFRNAYFILALSVALVMPACGEGEDPQSPVNETSSISGTVVYEPSGVPAAGVDVYLETSAGTAMMRGDHWYQAGHMMTNADGQFHFDYRHESMHRYRVGVRGQSDWHMCDGSGNNESGLVLRIPSPSR